MKLLVIGDLHLDHRKAADREAILTKIQEAAKDADVILDDGDLHPKEAKRENWKAKFDKPYLQVMGNHDYYFGILASHKWVRIIDGVKFVGATLWTDFNENDAYAHVMFKGYMTDSKVIEKIGFPTEDVKERLSDQIYKIHQEHRQFIFDEKPDVVITHHCPSYSLVHPKYVGEPGNAFFYSDMDDEIKANPNIKLWCCGHTHERFDLNIGATRMVVNPLGYPHESSVENYMPKLIEI
jgi:predicted phosphodiesterase